MTKTAKTTDARTSRCVPTLAEIVARWPATVDVPTAGEVFGLSRSHSYALAARNQFPAKVIKVGHHYRVSTDSILRVLSADT
jgi:hypothetical protein